MINNMSEVTFELHVAESLWIAMPVSKIERAHWNDAENRTEVTFKTVQELMDFARTYSVCMKILPAEEGGEAQDLPVLYLYQPADLDEE